VKVGSGGKVKKPLNLFPAACRGTLRLGIFILIRYALLIGGAVRAPRIALELIEGVIPETLRIRFVGD